MKSALEIDELVAVHVFKLRNIDGKWFDPRGVWVPRLPKYSTNIAAAWKVVEALKDFPFSLNREPDSETEVIFWDADECLERARATCLATPEAICLAALAAFGVRV